MGGPNIERAHFSGLPSKNTRRERKVYYFYFLPKLIVTDAKQLFVLQIEGVAPSELHCFIPRSVMFANLVH